MDFVNQHYEFHGEFLPSYATSRYRTVDAYVATCAYETGATFDDKGSIWVDANGNFWHRYSYQSDVSSGVIYVCQGNGVSCGGPIPIDEGHVYTSSEISGMNLGLRKANL